MQNSSYIMNHFSSLLLQNIKNLIFICKEKYMKLKIYVTVQYVKCRIRNIFLGK